MTIFRIYILVSLLVMQIMMLVGLTGLEPLTDFLTIELQEGVAMAALLGLIVVNSLMLLWRALYYVVMKMDPGDYKSA